MKPMSRFSKVARPTVGFGGILLMMLSIATLSLTHIAGIEFGTLLSAQASGQIEYG